MKSEPLLSPTPDCVRFELEGKPVAQGSMSVFNGNIVHKSGPELKQWRQAVGLSYAAQSAYQWDGPVAVQLEFRLPRPKAHYDGKGNLKDARPTFRDKKPDLDKLIRAVLDGLTGYAFEDDKQVVIVNATKVYDHTPGLTAEVWPVPERIPT